MGVPENMGMYPARKRRLYDLLYMIDMVLYAALRKGIPRVHGCRKNKPGTAAFGVMPEFPERKPARRYFQAVPFEFRNQLSGQG